jgi:hypothetical protein
MRDGDHRLFTRDVFSFGGTLTPLTEQCAWDRGSAAFMAPIVASAILGQPATNP